jgi:hypothetical protein
MFKEQHQTLSVLNNREAVAAPTKKKTPDTPKR